MLDLKHILRRLAATPMFTLATIVTLALGIGANTAIFSVIHSVLLKPLPYPEPDRLIGVWQTAPGVNIKDLNASMADYVTYREHSNTFADVAIWNGRSFTVTEFQDPERVEGMQATFRLLPMLGVQPTLGRAFEEKDSDSKGPEVIMISHGYWQRRFGGDPKVVGRRILSGGVAREIIGVLPKGFWFLDQNHDILAPIRYDRAAVRLAGYNFQCVARLKAGVTLDQANADVARIIALELKTFAAPQGMNLQMMSDARLAPNVRFLKDDLLGDIGKSLWVVMATVGIVLLIACANVANLLLVRAEGRGRELAVRAALGAGWGRIARELFAESLTLALMGGVAGIGFAIAIVKLVISLSPARLPRLEQISVDSTAMLFTLVISILAGLAFGAIPVWKHARVVVSEALRSGGRTVSTSRDQHLTRNGLTVVQVALAVVLLIGSGLMIRTFLSMRSVDPGFRAPESIQTLRISMSRNAATKDPEVRQMQQNLVNRIAAIPGVKHVGFIDGLPMTNFSSQDPIMARDRQYADNQIPPLRRFLSIGPGIFQALGTRMAAGREYDWTDLIEQRPVIIISENFAREYWGSAQAAIGKQIKTHFIKDWQEIVGVVADVRHDGADKKEPSCVYWLLRSPNSLNYVIRSSRAGTESFANEVRQAVWAVNPSMPITDMRTMKQIYDRSMSRTAFVLTLLGISGAMALLLAVVGVYAVISYTVAQRRKEIGIRMALGAPHGELKLRFVRDGMLWAGLGAAAGLIFAALFSGLMSALLFEIKPVDPITYGSVALAILAAAAVASYVPARRVTQVDPVEALRAE